MASKTSARQPRPQRPVPQPPNQPEVVQPLWILRSMALIILAAFVCGYLTMLYLFYQGQWQLVLHPERTTAAPVVPDAVPEQVRFGLDESATPQLTGWWIAAPPGSRFAADTVLYLRNGSGSLAGDGATLAALQGLGRNVFAFDYRGYGQSAAVHPSQSRMLQDAAQAWQYLADHRGIAAGHVVLFGDGVGGYLAATLARQHPQAAALVLSSPQPDQIGVARQDDRTRLVPVSLLFRERFRLEDVLPALTTPKLLLVTNAAEAGVAATAAMPRMVVTLRPQDKNTPLSNEQIGRFLDQYPTEAK
ncbi:MAG: alpha/beta hydrolase [Acidobacteriota bacterium]|nr:alpha/beta hydrolase [Acidobacteriota bacterium]